MTRRERIALLAVTAVTAVTRWLALSATPWDWDEFLFMLGMRHYDVASHHPHPPGFPVYIFFADLLQRLGFSDFHALQAVAFLGAVAIVPATYFLCRELEMTPPVSLVAASLLAFFPNVWFYGGTALSDVPSMTLVILAAALLLRGRRDARAYFAGAVVLAVAAGFRPQNLLVGVVPALLASRTQGWKRMLAAAAIGVAIIATSYGTAAKLTGVSDYREAVAEHQQYITAVDSFHAPSRPPLRNLVDDFFLRPYRQPLINIVISVLAAAGFVRLRRRSVLLALAMFAPLSILAFLYLDFHSVSRFSIGYIPVVAILAAEGLDLLARRAAPIVAAAIVAGMIVWSWPAIAEAHVHASPPFAAMTWLRAHASHTYVHGSMRPFSEYFLGDHTDAVERRYPPAVWPAGARSFFVAEKVVPAPNAIVFTRPRNALFDIARQRYFEVTVVPLAPIALTGGWYGEESGGGSTWEWMGHRGIVQLPPMPGRAHLTIRFYVPLNALKTPPTVTLTLDGRVVERIRATTGAIERGYDVAPGRTLVIETDEVVNPAAAHLGDDARDLGLRLNGITLE